MDFLKKQLNNAGEDAAIDQAANYINNATGGGSKNIIDQASSFAKKTIHNQDGSTTTQTTGTSEAVVKDGDDTVKEKTTTTATQNSGDDQAQVKTTTQSDYVDKGISMVEEKVFNISADKQNQQMNQKIAGYVREGVESFQHRGDGNSNQNN